MRVSKRVQYGVIIMVSIGMFSEDGNYVSLIDVSNMNGLPMKFLENIAANLKFNHLIVSQRGCKNGGYRLTKNPKDTTLAEIVRALDDSILCENTIPCDGGDSRSSSIVRTVNRVFWHEINQSILDYANSITLHSIIEQVKA